jgi:high-affinity nickel-transport protein
MLVLGFVLGMRHATDPDHVIAVTTMVARHRDPRSAALIGAVWGLGHTLTILIVGSGIILMGWVIPARVGLSLEFAVGLMLIVLGVASLKGSWGGVALTSAPTNATHAARAQLVRPMIVGVVHGLAGSAAVALLVLAAIREPLWSVVYLLQFGLGTIAGMMLVTVAIAVPLSHAGRRRASVGRGIRIASGAVSIAFGLFVAWQIGIEHGLFTVMPNWIPE